MKWLVICFMALCLLCPVAVAAQEDTSIIIEQELDIFDFSAWNYSDESFELNARVMIENYINGANNINSRSISDFITAKFKQVITEKLPLVLLLLAIGVVSGLATAVTPDDKSEIRSVMSFVSSAMCVAVIAGVIMDLVRNAYTAANNMAAFAEGAMPAMSLIMIASGRHATEAVFSPTMAFLTGSATLLVKTFIIPIVTAGFVFSAVGALGCKNRTGKLLTLFKSAVKWTCGIVTTVFTGAVAIYGLGARAHDTLTMKTTKYVIDKSIPIAGNFIAGSADTVLECFSAIKTASGAVFMLAIVIIIIKPLFDILGTVIALRIAAALCEPVADESIPKLMSDTADVAKLLFAVVAVLSVLFIIAVGLCACIFN